jgi:peptide/nickel transport system substrate-binding protein
MTTRQKRFWRKVSVMILGFTLAFTSMVYAAGEAVVINNWLPNWPKEVEIWRVLSRDLEKLGIQVELKSGTLDEWVGEIIGAQKPYHTVTMSWGGAPDRLEPDFFLSEWFHSSRAVKGGRNYGNFINQEYDKIVDAQRREMDVKKRQELIYKAQKIIAKENPFFGIMHHDYVQVYNKDRVEGVIPVMGNGIGFAYLPWTFYKAKPKTNIREVRVANLNDIHTLNPFATPEVENEGWLRMMYDTLLKRDADLNLIPWMAESWKVVDYTTVDIVLRDGMKFHDGKPVTVEDVKFTFDYILKWKFPALARVWKQIKSVEVMEGRRVRFNLVEPFAPFIPNILGHAPIVPKHIWEKIPQSVGVANPTDWPNPNPVGSGPFKFVEWRKGEYVHFKANKEHLIVPPNFDGLYLIITPTNESMMAALEKGNAEIMGYYVDGKQGKRLDALPHLKMVSTSNQGLVEIRPNLKMKPFDDPAFRRAFQHAINRKAMLEIAVDGCGTICQNTPIHPQIKQWHDPDAITPEFNLEKARGILKTAGYTWDEKGKLHSPK